MSDGKWFAFTVNGRHVGRSLTLDGPDISFESIVADATDKRRAQ